MSQEEILSRLPDACYSISDYSGEVILLKKGELGYYSTPYSDLNRETNRSIADYLNSQLGISQAQEQAMKAGSLFGWSIPAINPDLWAPQDNAQTTSATIDMDDEIAFSLNNGEYFLYIQTYEDGYDYTIYHKDYSEYDGGQLDDPSISIGEAARSIIQDFASARGAFRIETYDPDLLQEAVYEAEIPNVTELLSSTQLTSLNDRIENAQARMNESPQNEMQQNEARIE